MRPQEYIDSIYHKTKNILEVEDVWAPFYLNKIFVQNYNNAIALSKIVDYCVYIEPTHYFYLLWVFIPQQLNVRYTYPKKQEEIEEDILAKRVRDLLGYSMREYLVNKKQIEASILKDREYWAQQLGVNLDTKRTRKV